MTDDGLERARRRHPAGRSRPVPALRAVHPRDPDPRPGSDRPAHAASGRLSALGALAVLVLVAGALAAVWGDWRWLPTGILGTLAVGIVGAHLDRRPR